MYEEKHVKKKMDSHPLLLEDRESIVITEDKLK